MKAKEKGKPVMITKIVVALSGLLASCLMLTQPAAAQATRTWVSGVGDDVNPCSRTAPCKTFAGAISKTAAGGEINCLDPGGFGAVTITKSISIICDHVSGGALAGGNGIVVNTAAGGVVFLSGLDIQGVNPPLNGVRFVNGTVLYIQNSSIRGFTTAINLEPAGAAQVTISNVVIVNNQAGIRIAPTGAGSANVTVDDTTIAYNNGAAVASVGAATTARVADSTIISNVTGLSVQSSGKILTYGDNRIHTNGTNGAFTGTVAKQ